MARVRVRMIQPTPEPVLPPKPSVADAIKALRERGTPKPLQRARGVAEQIPDEIDED
jgi:hypothetical protein